MKGDPKKGTPLKPWKDVPEKTEEGAVSDESPEEDDLHFVENEEGNKTEPRRISDPPPNKPKQPKK